ncbi:P-loop containing nucleoside triphosphate hydrolase protein [Apiospora kogelbergensis]|uniref:P-loop containing nucleoside triphosphate hydrolase protein n=1 Tax=Apiospora kogelbergensis TaxID=1337665 RepID=A0AAW0R4P0_9PEZI
MKVALQHVATDNGEAAAAILQNIVEPSMDRILKDAQRKTDDILKSHRNIHPITYNIDILAKINRLAAKKKRAEFEIIRKTFLAVAKSQDTIKHGSLDLMDLVDDLVEGNMNDSPMKTNAGLEESIALYALDVLEAYYDKDNASSSDHQHTTIEAAGSGDKPPLLSSYAWKRWFAQSKADLEEANEKFKSKADFKAIKKKLMG